MHTILYIPNLRVVQDFIFKSPFFWIALIVMIIVILIYHNYFRKKGQSSRSLESIPGARIRYSGKGRSGQVDYISREAKFALYYEMGGGDCVAWIDVPSVQQWETVTGLPLARRDEVLQAIGTQVVKDQTTGGRGYFKIEGNAINIYV